MVPAHRLRVAGQSRISLVTEAVATMRRPVSALGILSLLCTVTFPPGRMQQPLTVRGFVFAEENNTAVALAEASVTVVIHPAPDSTVFRAGTETSSDGRFVLRVGVAPGTDCRTLSLIVRKATYRTAEIRSLCDTTQLLRMGIPLRREAP